MGKHEPLSLTATALQQYDFLPTTAKPIQRSNGKYEWTVLAVILATAPGKEPIPVAMGTGVKCLPHDKLSQIGDCIHDSHAEVLARRSFVRWLLSEMLHILHDSTYHSVLLQYIDQDRRFDLRPDVDFHLYVSQAPCGDGSISSLAASQSQSDAELMTTLVHKDDKPAVEADYERGRWDYSKKGVLRTKPGRGDSVLAKSMSCSDKIAMWNVVGIQGAAAMHFLDKPIYLESIIVGEMFNAVDLQRALNDRLHGIGDLPMTFQISRLWIDHDASHFEASQGRLKKLHLDQTVSAFASTCWSLGSTVEVIINGRLRGHSSKGNKRPTICKAELFALCQRVAMLLGNSNIKVGTTYRQVKDASIEYQLAKSKLLVGPFKGWLKSGKDLEDFRTGA